RTFEPHVRWKWRGVLALGILIATEERFAALLLYDHCACAARVAWSFELFLCYEPQRLSVFITRNRRATLRISRATEEMPGLRLAMHHRLAACFADHIGRLGQDGLAVAIDVAGLIAFRIRRARQESAGLAPAIHHRCAAFRAGDVARL